MFLLKKLVSGLLYPLPVCLLLLAAGVLLLWFGKRRALGRGLATAALLLLVVFSLRPLPRLAVRGLEDRYETFLPGRPAGREVAWVVVLGGGAARDPQLPPNDQLSAVSLARLVEGIRILRLVPEARLLLSGAQEAVSLERTAVLLGVAPERIRCEARSRDTREQARDVREIVGAEPFVLVTSAAHLPRAMALFEQAGMAPVPGPANRLAKRTDEPLILRFYPREGYLEDLQRAWHEYLGLAWARIREVTG
jgi:uncharacterized SAM-binding protein YcdF (DUF218 family)